MHTFRKLPNTSPKTKAAMAKNKSTCEWDACKGQDLQEFSSIIRRVRHTLNVTKVVSEVTREQPRLRSQRLANKIHPGGLAAGFVTSVWHLVWLYRKGSGFRVRINPPHGSLAGRTRCPQASCARTDRAGEPARAGTGNRGRAATGHAWRIRSCLSPARTSGPNRPTGAFCHTTHRGGSAGKTQAAPDPGVRSRSDGPH